MLTIKKPIFDVSGNIDMSIKHYTYEIKIKTRPNDTNNKDKYDMLSRVGNLRDNIIGYPRSATFKARFYKLAEYFYRADYKWFIRDTDVSDATIKAILEDKIYFYNVEVIVCKYGVGLCSVNSFDDDYASFSKVCTLDSKKDLIELINSVIKVAYEYAIDNESTVFSSVDDYNFDSI